MSLLPNDPTWREVRKPAPAFEHCNFYHSLEVPVHGFVHGQWDLRASADDYLGRVAFAGRSVLEVGPASGFLSFHMERAGATVTVLEPPMSRLWDKAPMPGLDAQAWRKSFSASIEGVRNSFWYLHHLYRSEVRMVEADPETLPPAVGEFDVGVFASVLLHCRSPISVLEGCARQVRDTIVVTDLYDANLGELPVCRLLPRVDVRQVDTWWALTPAFVVNALALLGFGHPEVRIHYHKRGDDGRMVPFFSVVAKR